jgi:preprotein translocase subunit SecY
MLNTRRRILITIAVLLAWRLGSAIPIPGLMHDGYPQAPGLGQIPAPVWSILRPGWSILMLGVTPLFSVLTLVELLKIALPELRRWQDRQGKARLRLYIFIASLVFAAMQALALISGYERLAQPLGTAFEVAFVIGLVAGAALVCWFADAITLYGVGNGFWMLLSLPILANMGLNIWSGLNIWWYSHDRPGRVWGYPIYLPTQAELGLVAIGLTFVAIFLLVLVQYPRLKFRGNGESPQKGRDPWADGSLMATVWPPILAGWIAPWLILIAIVFNLPTGIAYFAMIPAGMALILICTILQQKAMSKQDVNEGAFFREETKPVLTLALVQAVIWAIPLLWKQLNGPFPIITDGGSVIIATAFTLDFAKRLFFLRESTGLQAAEPSA